MSRKKRDNISEEEEKRERERNKFLERKFPIYERETDHQTEGMIPKTSAIHWTVQPESVQSLLQTIHAHKSRQIACSNFETQFSAFNAW